MNETVILVGIGLIIGILLASGVWLVLYIVGKAQRQLLHEKNLVMKSVSEESAEADKVLFSAVAKTMNTHSLRSALAPKVEKMRKLLTANMHVLDVYFVKYMETRIAAYEAAYTAAESAPEAFTAEVRSEARPEARIPEPKARPFEMSFEPPPQDINVRLEPASIPPAPSVRAEARVDARVRASPDVFIGQRQVPEQKAPVPPPRAPAKPAAQAPVDRRTGAIPGIDQDIKVMQPPAGPKIERPPQRPVQPRPPVVERKPERVEMPRPAARGEEVFDFETAISPRVSEQQKKPPDQRPLPPDRTDQTLRWDREELTGAAARPESIVVEGAEVARQKEPAPQKKPAPAGAQAAARPAAPGLPPDKQENPVISGEDIENKMDSFFGLGG